MNKILLTGRLTSKPELKSTTNGKLVTDITIAVNRSYKNTEGKYDADFINCMVWNNAAEILSKYCDKGSKLLVEGEIRVDNYKDKDNNTRYKTYILVNRIELLDSSKKKEDTSKEEENDPYEEFANETELTDEELPF